MCNGVAGAGGQDKDAQPSIVMSGRIHRRTYDVTEEDVVRKSIFLALLNIDKTTLEQKINRFLFILNPTKSQYRILVFSA